MALTRRQLIHHSAAGAGLVIVGNLTPLFSQSAAAAPIRQARRSWASGYGVLTPDPAKLLDLPDGFTYKIISEAGKPLTGAEGTLPGAFDGSALFEVDGRRLLIRNSEQDIEAEFPASAATELTYDPAAQGGTTTTEIDADNNVIAEYVSLAGTATNCAGGVTPWGTWLTCEETEDRIDDNGFTKDHGFVFEVDPVIVENNTNPTPLEGLVRFDHEAVAIDPATGIVYLTEDASAPNGLLYRATPATPLGGYGSLRDGAVLEALIAHDESGGFVADLSEVSEAGTVLTTEWAAIPDPLATEDSTRVQLNKVTRSRKLEGMWWGDDAAYVVASYARNDDGSVGEHDGQVWRLDPGANTMELVIQFGVDPDPASDTFDSPDNITVSPWGGLLLCADGEGVQHLYTINADGRAKMFARDARDLAEETGSEFTGATFSADGETLFVNLQSPGVTFAITGPWEGEATPSSSTPPSSVA
jgi:uncharacterized protein